ncbi:TPA: porin family protein [Vibrio parahaemolyticus]
MKLAYLLALFSMQPALAQAEQIFQPSAYYLKGGINFLVRDDNKKNSEAFGVEAMLGAEFDKGIFIEGGYQNFSLIRNDLVDLDAWALRVNWKYPVSDYASVYAGGGGTLVDSDFSPSAQLGIQYQISRNWVADISYLSIFDIDKVDDDLYSLNLSFVYRFPSSVPVVVDETPNVIAPVIKPPATIMPQPPICMMKKRKYILVKGDFLIKVADTYEMSLAQLICLNSQLHGRDLNLVYPGESINVSSAKVCK